MKNKIGIILTLIVLLAAAGGYWLGTKQGDATHEKAAASTASETGGKERKILYYRNPMGLPDTSPVPKKDPMGMDYVPVFEGDEASTPSAVNDLRIGTDKVQKLGVKTEKASIRSIDSQIRAAARIEPDERRIFTIAPKFEGYVERLYVNATGQTVGKGQALFDVYSPELVSAQREYMIAAQGMQALKGGDSDAQVGMQQLAQASLSRLRNWDISTEQVKKLAKSGQVSRTMTFLSPVSGVITEKKAVQGMRFMPGDTLYQVADLSSVWVLADVFEQDIGQVTLGSVAKVKINAYPDKSFEGKITYIYPTLNEATRTVQVRIELSNSQRLLKPGMFANVDLTTPGKTEGITVPASAVIDSGIRQIVLVQLNDGHFQARQVKIGQRSENVVQVLEGVAAGEDVVVAANFLIDAESNLKAAIGGFGHENDAHGSGSTSGDGAQMAQRSKGDHQGQGIIESVDFSAGVVSIDHGPVASLKWPAMTMEFKVANESLLKGMKAGSEIVFDFVERKPGEWVVTKIQSASGPRKSVPAPVPAPASNPHAGH